MTSADTVSLKEELFELRHATHRRFLSAETTAQVTKLIKDILRTAARKGLGSHTLSIRDTYTQLGFVGDALSEDELIYIRKYIVSWFKEQGINLNEEQANNSDILDIVWYSEG